MLRNKYTQDQNLSNYPTVQKRQLNQDLLKARATPLKVEVGLFNDDGRLSVDTHASL